VLRKFEDFSPEFLNTFPEKVQRAIAFEPERKSLELIQQKLIRMENSDLMVSPTKLFDPSQLVITSD